MPWRPPAFFDLTQQTSSPCIDPHPGDGEVSGIIHLLWPQTRPGGILSKMALRVAVLTGRVSMSRQRMPEWLRTRLPEASSLVAIERATYAKGLSTVCREARCPNQGECARRGTATFLILGDRCTRNCRFCAVRHGTPAAVRVDEPQIVADAIATLGLTHAVVTSVTRDDLPDGGANQFARTIRAIRRTAPHTTIEVLVPDFQGSEDALLEVIDAVPDVFNHNLETVSRLYPVLRQGASYRRSLELLRKARESSAEIVTKSGIMVGVGESRSELVDLTRDVVAVGCTVLTIGQYLQPSRGHHPVERFVTPEEFAELEVMALAEGIGKVASGPLVRSSYMAGTILGELGSADARGVPHTRSAPCLEDSGA